MTGPFPEFSQSPADLALDPELLARELAQELLGDPLDELDDPAFALADVAVYLAILSKIGPEALAVTTNCSIDFMRKPKADTDLLCEVRILKLGRALAVGEAYIRSAGQEDLVARAGLTYSIPPRGLKNMG